MLETTLHWMHRFKTTSGALFCGPCSPTFGGVQVLECLRVGIDEVEVVLQPRHLALVPRRPQLAQPGDLVHELLLLADPKRTTAEISIRGSSKLVYI